MQPIFTDVAPREHLGSVRHHAQHPTGRVDPTHKAVDVQQLASAQVVHLLVRGMGCPACAMRVHNALLSIEGVLSADVLLLRGVALVRYDPARVKPEDLPDALATAAESGRHQYTARILDHPV